MHRTSPLARAHTYILRLALAAVAALAIPVAVSASAEAATVTGTAGTLRYVYGWGTGHCNPNYTTNFEIDAPFVARTPPSGAGIIGGQQPVSWSPYLQKWTSTGWKTVWKGPFYAATNYSTTEAIWSSVWINTRLLAGGGSGYYRAGGSIVWAGTSWTGAGALNYELTAGEYFSGGGANNTFAVRTNTAYCWLNA